MLVLLAQRTLRGVMKKKKLMRDDEEEVDEEMRTSKTMTMRAPDELVERLTFLFLYEIPQRWLSGFPSVVR